MVDKMNKKKKIFIISNTHWDREWYISLDKYRVRLVKLMDRLINLMEKKEDYIFITDGQYVVIEDYLSVRPEMTDRVKKLIESGRLKVGPWFTQPLETLISGEAMVRNLMYGIKETEKYGPVMKFSYMVDEFGHASQTPQILQGFGIDGAMAWRGIPKDAKSIFEWYAPDGSRVYMCHTRNGYGEATALSSNPYDFTREIDGIVFQEKGYISQINDIMSVKEEVTPINSYCWLNGVDHSWAQEDILEVVEIINQAYPEYEVKQSTIEEYFATALSEYKDNNIEFQQITGELMYPHQAVLESTHSCRADQKMAHYKSERTLERIVEPVTCIDWALNGSSSKWAIDKAWKLILENQAHDSLGCTSIDSVYVQMMARYDIVDNLSEQIVEDAFKNIMSHYDDTPSMFIYNPNSHDYSGVIVGDLDIPLNRGFEEFELYDNDGNKVEYSVISSFMFRDNRYNPEKGHPSNIDSKRYKIAVNVNCIKGFSFNRFTIKSVKKQKAVCLPYCIGELENNNLKVKINQNGTLCIFDKINGKKYDNLMLFEDGGESGNFYIHKRPQNDKLITSLGEKTTISLVINNNNITTYRVSLQMMVPSHLERNKKDRSNDLVKIDISYLVSLRKDAKSVDLEIEITNRAKDHRFRVLFPTGFKNATKSIAGQPFDMVERDITTPAAIEEDDEVAWTTHPMQDFCNVSDKRAGLMIAAGGIYEYEVIDNERRDIALTLFRSTVLDEYDVNFKTIKKTQLGQLLKTLYYRLSIIPHGGDWKEAYPVAIMALNPPMIITKKAPDEAFLKGYQKPRSQFTNNMNILQLDGENIIVTNMKCAEKGKSVIVRLLNYSEEKKEGKLSLNLPGVKVYEAYLTRLDEQRISKFWKSNDVEFMISPKEVLTIEFCITEG